ATLLRMPVTEPALPQQRGPIFASIAEGARFVAGNQIMLGAMALDMFSVLLGGAVSMLPAFIKDILHAGPEALGILRAAPAVGSIAIALWLTRHPLQRHAGRVLLVAVACFGLCTMARAVPPPVVVDAAAGAVRRLRRRVGGDALHHHAAGHPGRDARPGVV